jgi:Fe-S cluster biogenesis protein NfuA
MAGPADEALRQRVADVVREQVLPALHMATGAVEVIGVEGGVVEVRLSGACASCASATRAAILSVEDELRRRVPEVEYVEAVP